jgi:hypothetical protein
MTDKGGWEDWCEGIDKLKADFIPPWGHHEL